MELPILCARCGTHFQSGTDIPPTSSLFEFDPRKMPLGGIPRAGEPCPICGFLNGSEAIRDTLAIIYTVRTAALRREETARLAAAIDALRESQAGVEEAVAALADREPKVSGLRRVIPRGQGNTVAFLALLVSCLTLAENILGDLPALKEVFREDGSSLDVLAYPRLYIATQGEMTKVTFTGRARLRDGFSLFAIPLSNTRVGMGARGPMRGQIACHHIPVVASMWHWRFPRPFPGLQLTRVDLVLLRAGSESERRVKRTCARTRNATLTHEELALDSISLTGPAFRWSNTPGEEHRTMSVPPGRPFSLLRFN
ncbi:hypothetical protein Pmi06nite_04410 [Planotetraspora mira]|uniref:Uncharacterized protein n=2 Tax=Planotetraspora mira TaxID=58121 RepID=A0A8J3TM04_9ACTN|nr:hypothetical protein Pmi06nite_04410 [Planotetraspora mira]